MADAMLESWQSVVWAAGCLERVAPYLRARATPRATRFYGDSLASFWAGRGELSGAATERIAAVGAWLSDLHDDREPDVQVLMILLAVATGAAVPSCDWDVHDLAREMAEFWVNLDGPEDEDWGGRETRAQGDTLAMLSRPPAEATAAIRELSVRLGAEWAAGLAEQGLLDADAAGPELAVPPANLPYRAGDVVAVRCPWTETVATSSNGSGVGIRWPWAVLDPDSRYEPDGTFAFPVNVSTEPWWPYQLRPPAAELGKGDRCAVGIPPSRCYLVDSLRRDPPLDDGFLPRFTTGVAMLPAGSGYRQAALVWLERAEDAAPSPEAVEAVAAATAVGGHADAVERWRTWSQVPYPATVAEELFDKT